MKILHLSSEYPPQQVFGLGRFVHDLAVAQGAAGDEVHVVTNSLGGRAHDVIQLGVHVHRVAFPPPPRAHDDSLTVTQFNVQLMERAAPLVRDLKPDVLNLHDWLTLPGGIPLAEVYDLPYVFTVHDTCVGKRAGDLGPSDRYMAELEAWGTQVAHRVICCSRAVERELVSTYRAPAERIRIVPCGVDARTFAAEATPAHLAAFRSVLVGADDPLVVYLGRLDPEKGLGVLINAVPAVLKRWPRARFVLVGKGLLAESLQQHVQQAGLSGSVRFTGYVSGEPLALLLRVADVLVVPSTYEPFGIVALEGMINRLPVLVPDSTGLAEIVTDGVDGRTFRTGVAADLADRLLELLDDKPLRRKLGEAGYRTASERYTWSRVAEMSRAVYTEAIEQSTRAMPPPRPIALALPTRPEPTPSGPAVTHAPTWIVLLVPEALEPTRRFLSQLNEHTREPHRVLAVDGGGDSAVTRLLVDAAQARQIYRLILNAPGTLPRELAGAALVQAIHLLADEYVEDLAIIEGELELRPGWLTVALSALHSLDDRTPVVALGAHDGKAHWLVRRSFFGRFGLPPVGKGALPLAGESGYYTRVLGEAGCRFAVLNHQSSGSNSRGHS